MSVALQDWLNSIATKYASDFDEFVFYVFVGTQAEVIPRLGAWPQRGQWSIHHLDIGKVVVEKETVAEATSAIGAELQRLGSYHDRLLITISGLNLMASLFPGGVLEPIFRWLRRGNRIVVAIVPPLAPRRLPANAHLSDWRSLVLANVDAAYIVGTAGATP
jgi:hypothetical protein